MACVIRSVLTPGAPASLVLPAHAPEAHTAAAAHAAAHLTQGGAPFERGTLKPLQQALLGTLEDARVEHAALRSLPGLLALWCPWHADATPDSGVGFAALLRRLQRRLLDPRYTDPHPWIEKAWRLYQALQRQQAATPAALRALASLLGHDLGQMRMPFEAPADAVGPAYRDDNRHLWTPLPACAEAAGSTPSRQEVPPAPPSGRRVLHPEWDWRIARLRPGWCTVIEDEVRAHGPSSSRASSRASTPALRLSGRPVVRSRQPEGPWFDTAGLVTAAIARRQGRSPPAELHRGHVHLPRRRHVLVLLDRSASTAAPAPPGWPRADTLLQAEASIALALLQALPAQGHAVALQAFASKGRHAVHVDWLQYFDTAANDAPERLQGLRSEGSTRLGTALRHATAALHQRRNAHVLLLTDGEPHDVDVHERRYLVDDLQHAVHAAQRACITVGCLVLGGAPTPVLKRCFDTGRCCAVQGAASWPAAVSALLA